MQSEVRKEAGRLWQSFIFPLFLLALIWCIKIFETISGIHFNYFGIEPRNITGLKGIILSPLLHADFNHLLSNSMPLLVLCTALIYFYGRISYLVITLIWLSTGTLVWMMARPSYHIGASGIIYGFASFLFFSGFIKRNNSLKALSLLVIIFYGGMVWGILPTSAAISWESHLFGALTGLFAAWIFKSYGPVNAERKTDNEAEHSISWDINKMDIPPSFRIKHDEDQV